MDVSHATFMPLQAWASRIEKDTLHTVQIFRPSSDTVGSPPYFSSCWLLSGQTLRNSVEIDHAIKTDEAGFPVSLRKWVFLG